MTFKSSVYKLRAIQPCTWYMLRTKLYSAAASMHVDLFINVCCTLFAVFTMQFGQIYHNFGIMLKYDYFVEVHFSKCL